MTCKEHYLRELLPSYLEGKLEHDPAKRVELHVARCADCAEELNLLRSLAAEPAPDPGEAFWSSLPDRVYREVQRHNRSSSPSQSPGSIAAFFLSRWTQGAVATAAVLLVSWLALRPAPVELSKTDGPVQAFSSEDIYSEPGDSLETELKLADAGRLENWMERESTPLRDAVERVAAAGNGPDRSLEEYLSALDRDQLEALAAALSKMQEAGT